MIIVSVESTSSFLVQFKFRHKGQEQDAVSTFTSDSQSKG